MGLLLDGNLLHDVSKLVNLLNLPRDLTVAGLFEQVLRFRDVGVRGELGVDRRRRLDSRVRGRSLRDTQRATEDAVDAREEAARSTTSQCHATMRRLRGYSLVGVRDGEAGADERAVDENGSDLAELVLSLEVALLLLSGETLDTAEKTLNEGRTRVDLEHLLLLGEVPHVLVVHLRVRGACAIGMSLHSSKTNRSLTDELIEIGGITVLIRDDGARTGDKAVGDDN